MSGQFISQMCALAYQDMSVEEQVRIVNVKKQAYQALKDIMHQEHLVHVTCGDIGTHYAMWVEYMGVNGTKKYTRQFSWDKQYPDAQGARMQWIYDAFKDYRGLKEWYIQRFE